MAITTTKGHVSRAIDFFNKSNIFFCMGRTTPWEDDNNPPVPQPDDSITEAAGYKLVESKYLVKPLESSEVTDDVLTITYRGSKWKVVPLEEAMDEGARWVYVSTQLSYDEFPIDLVYRQIGVYTGLERAADVVNGKMNLLPDEVANPGVLEVLDNRTPIHRDAYQRELLSIIIEY